MPSRAADCSRSPRYLLWTSSAAFTATINGLNRAYRVEDSRRWWRARLYAIGLTLALSLLMILAFTSTVFGTHLQHLIAAVLGPTAGMLAQVARWTLTILATTLVVAAIYYARPRSRRSGNGSARGQSCSCSRSAGRRTTGAMAAIASSMATDTATLVRPYRRI